MYKFVHSLTNSTPWINHFKKQATSTSPWHPSATQNVIILPEEITDKGINDPSKINSIAPIEQTTEQAKAALAKEIDELPPPKKRKKKSPPSRKQSKKKQATTKRKVAAVTAKTKDIFSRERKSTNTAPSKD